MEQPKAFIDKKTSAFVELQRMLSAAPELYDKCISTPGFAYGFSQLANRAIHYDWLQQVAGIIPKDYPLKPPPPKHAGDEHE